MHPGSRAWWLRRHRRLRNVGQHRLWWDLYGLEPRGRDVFPPRDYAPREAAACHRVLRVHRETFSCLLADAQLEVVVRSEEHMIVVCVHDRREIRIECDVGLPARELALPEVLKPALWTLHALQPAMQRLEDVAAPAQRGA